MEHRTDNPEVAGSNPASPTKFMNKEIEKIVKKIYDEVMEYESDTFSADGCGLSPAEALKITAMLIKRRVSIGDNVDGVTLDFYLEEIRS